VSLADVGPAGGAVGASWGSQGIIAFTAQTNSPIQQVSDAGGTLKPLTHLAEGGHGLPELLPDGNGLLYDIFSGGGPPKVAVQSLKTGESRDLLQTGALPRYAPSGHIIYL